MRTVRGHVKFDIYSGKQSKHEASIYIEGRDVIPYEVSHDRTTTSEVARKKRWRRKSLVDPDICRVTPHN